ncbi:phospholipase-like protein [Tanacetum coccineum]
MEEPIEVLDAKITIRPNLSFLTDVKKKLDQPGNEKCKTLFLATKFSIWLDLPAFANDNHLLNYIFHHQEESYKGIPNSKFLDRIFPDRSSKRVKKVKGDDLMELFTNDELWFGISDHDAVRVCLLLVATIVFMGRETRYNILDNVLELVDDLPIWNSYPWGEYFWRIFYRRTFNVLHRKNERDSKKDKDKSVEPSKKKIKVGKVSVEN